MPVDKKYSERKHRMVQTFLEKHFPDCIVKYDGLEGHDHQIIYGNKTVYVETKTCIQNIGGGYMREEECSYLRLGRFEFKQQKNLFPYKKSQHEDLVDLDGWYIFVVGNRIRGVPAKTVDERIHGNWVTKRVTWDKIIFLSYPDWLDRLKKQVYSQ